MLYKFNIVLFIVVLIYSCNNNVTNDESIDLIEKNKYRNVDDNSITMFSSYKNDTILIYESIGLLSFDAENVKELILSINNQHIIFNVMKVKYDSFPVKPYVFDIDNNNILFFVKSRDNEKFYLNSNKSVYIIKNESYRFFTWEEFILKYNYVTIDISENTRIFKNDNMKEQKDKFNDKDPSITIRAIEIKDELLRIGWIEDNKVVYDGWIKWRDDNKLLIEIIFKM